MWEEGGKEVYLLDHRVLGNHLQEQAVYISILLQRALGQMHISIHEFHYTAIQQPFDKLVKCNFEGGKAGRDGEARRTKKKQEKEYLAQTLIAWISLN